MNRTPPHSAALLVALAFAMPAAAVEVTPFALNSGMNNRDTTISRDGTLLLTTIMSPDNRVSAIVQSRRVNGEWQPLTLAPFSGRYPDIEPMFSPDGKRLWFASRRPAADEDDVKSDWDIWYVESEGEAWSEPVNAGSPVNSPGDEFYPAETVSGKLYFTAEREGGHGREDILIAIPDGNGGWSAIENAGDGINTSGYEFNAFVAPDESFVLFTSQGGRDDEIGGGDLYISHRTDDGRFGEARLLPKDINSVALDYCPFVHDGRLWFSSRRAAHPAEFADFDALRTHMDSSGNGLGDIYHVPVDVLTRDP